MIIKHFCIGHVKYVYFYSKGYIADEPFHSLRSTWLLLADSEVFSAGAKGYLKVSVNVLGPGDEVPVK